MTVGKKQPFAPVESNVQHCDSCSISSDALISGEVSGNHKPAHRAAGAAEKWYVTCFFQSLSTAIFIYR